MPLPELSDKLKESAAFLSTLKTAMGEPARELNLAFTANVFPVFKPHTPKELVIDSIDGKGIQLIVLDSLIEKELITGLSQDQIKIIDYNYDHICSSSKRLSSVITDVMETFNMNTIEYEPNKKEMVPLSTINPFCKKSRMKEVIVKPYGCGKHYTANQEGKVKAVAKRRAARKRNKK